VAELVVQNFLRMSERSTFDTETGALAPSLSPDAPPAGYFTELGGEAVVFYASRGKLHLRVGETRCELGRGADLSAIVGLEDLDGVRPPKLAGPGFVEKTRTVVSLDGENLRKLRVETEGAVVLRHQYPNPIDPPMEFDLTMAEEEDFDLGLFVANVASSPDRVAFLLEKWSADGR
jgi:hypothetical protein